jgi:hypothetical protein
VDRGAHVEVDEAQLAVEVGVRGERAAGAAANSLASSKPIPLEAPVTTAN